jgi:hypothetical protein
MDIRAKLQVKTGQRLATVAASDEDRTVIETDVDTPEDADAIIAFVRDTGELATVAAPALDAARKDALAWIAYPKAGQLGTDLNRDILAKSLTGQGIQPVRQVAINEVWSALRFRPSD